MFDTSLSQLKVFAEEGNYACLSVQIHSDTETPISLYHKLCRDKSYSFLLESAEQDARMGRYSFIGFDPIVILEFDEQGNQDPLQVIRDTMREIKMVNPSAYERFEAGFVGYFAYDAIRHFEQIPMPDRASASQIPESVFFLPRVVVAFDHIKHVIHLHYLMSLEGNIEENLGTANQYVEQLFETIQRPVAIPFLRKHSSLRTSEDLTITPSEPDFIKQVQQAKAHIEAGDIFQVVLSHSMEAQTEKSAFELYRTLRQENPSPYMYFLSLGDFTVVGASPETMVRLEEDEILLRPIAGTRPRGRNEEEDRSLEFELNADPKERAEHMMLVDLGRNDVGRVAQDGTVEVTDMMYTQRFSSVMHLVSDVTGQVRPDKDMFDVFRACFPAGTLSGAPKIRAAEIISSLEKQRRGIYGGAVGYFDFSGNMDFAIAIRTMVYRDGTVYLQAGAGVVHDSIPEKEYQECFHKATSCLSVL